MGLSCISLFDGERTRAFHRHQQTNSRRRRWPNRCRKYSCCFFRRCVHCVMVCVHMLLHYISTAQVIQLEQWGMPKRTQLLKQQMKGWLWKKNFTRCSALNCAQARTLLHRANQHVSSKTFATTTCSCIPSKECSRHRKT